MASAAAAEVTVAEAVECPADGCSDDFCAARTFSAGNGCPSKSVPCFAATCLTRLVRNLQLVGHCGHWNRVGGISTGTSGGKEAGGKPGALLRPVCFVLAIFSAAVGSVMSALVMTMLIL